MEDHVQEEKRKVQQEMHDLWIQLKNDVTSKNLLFGASPNSFVNQNMALLETAVKKVEDSIFPRLECLLQALGESSPSHSAHVPNCSCSFSKKQIKHRKSLLAESFQTPSKPLPNLTLSIQDRRSVSLDEELYFAVLSSRLDDILRLLDAGADINSKTNGETPLQAAAWNGDESVVSTLLARDADVNLMATMAPLHYASFRGHSLVVSLMIQYGADVDIRDENGMTPLHNAAIQGHMECILLLLDAGADPAIKNDFHDTPLDVSTDRDISDLLDTDKTVVLF